MAFLFRYDGCSLLIFVLIISFTMLQSQRRYEQKQEELKQQQALVQSQQEQLQEQQEQLDKLIGIRTELIEALKKEFDGTDLSVKVDEKTGSIALDSSILFDSGQFALKASGEELLQKFLPKYIGVLTDKQFNDYISEIIIEGHTDTQETIYIIWSCPKGPCLSQLSAWMKTRKCCRLPRSRNYAKL